jgi:uracil-DNA glycosylase family 4
VTVAALQALECAVHGCRRCPRLVAWREEVASEKRAAFRDETYWGRPIAGFGDPAARILLLGLAPAAHGGNRTGRVFTGDRSGDWLFASLYRVGLAALPTSTRAGDGQRLLGARMLAAVRCAPPLNKPTNDERDDCAPWLHREVAFVLPSVRVVVCLGSFGWLAALGALAANGVAVPRPRPKFGHDAATELTGPHGPMLLLGSFHPSQQNTFTGRLTEPMLDHVLRRARIAAGLPGPR